MMPKQFLTMSGYGEHDVLFMAKALEEAQKALKLQEVPVGALVVKDYQVISKAYNQKEAFQTPTAHAELQAIHQACQRLGNWRLLGCTLYTTLAPCIMCWGAILSSRISKVVYAASDPQELSGVDLVAPRSLHSPITVTQGVLEQEASAMLKSFFQQQRDKRKEVLKA